MKDVDIDHFANFDEAKNIESPIVAQQEALEADQSLSLKHKLPTNEEEKAENKKSKKDGDIVMDAAELRRKRREEEKEAKRLKKIVDEEKKREEKRRKKEEEIEKRQLRKEKEEEERNQKRAAIEAEKLAKKEQKEKEKLEKLKKKELEQRQKDEKKKLEEQEKALKREELERKRELKVKEREEKLNEKKRLEEEKKKEEEQKKQKRSITNFFKVKSTSERESPIENNMLLSTITSASASTENFNVKDTQINASEVSDFDQFFLPFYVNSNVTIATAKRSEGAKWDSFLQNKKFTIEPHAVQEQRPEIAAAKAIDVVQLLNTGMQQEAESLFANVPLKYIRFYENRKPPYFGTYSHLPDKAEASILTHPFTKIESWKVEYDVDSDFSDAEDDDGDDVDAEDDEDEEEDEDVNNSDIDEFVESDDSNPSTSKQMILGPLVPLVRYFNHNSQDKGDDEFSKYFQSLQWQASRSDIQFPIDPFKNYWETNEKVQALEPNVASSVMGSDETKAVVVDKGPMQIKKKVVSDEKAVEALVQFIKVNSSLTINTMAELASKQIPELSKSSRALVKNTIKDVARFDKKSSLWELV